MDDELYVWQAPRDLDAATAEALVADWEAAGGDPAASPFAPSTDVGWFVRELRTVVDTVALRTDAPATTSTKPVWLSANDVEPPARVAVLRASALTPDDLSDLLGLAAKYDLVVYDRRARRVHLPLAELAAYASATFWPRGAIQAFLAGVVGLVLVVGGFLVPIPILNIVLVIVGGILVLGSVFTFVHEGRARLRRGPPAA